MQLEYLDASFRPGENDVICGRGKKCYGHEGNEKFKLLCAETRSVYTNAKTKDEKSAVVGMIIGEVRRRSPDGGFVKQDQDGKWYEVGDFLAREKTSQAFREILHANYKSSTVSRRRERQLKRSHKATASRPHSRTDEAPRVESDRRHSVPALAHGLAEAITLARRELGDEEEDSSEGNNGDARKRKATRRSSDPQISTLSKMLSPPSDPQLSTWSKMISSPSSNVRRDMMMRDCSPRQPQNAPFPVPPRKRLPFSEPRTLYADSRKKHFSFVVPPVQSSALVGGKSENAAQNSTTNQKRVPEMESSLPNIPISALLKNGKPIRVNPEDLRKACEVYASQNQPVQPWGCWDHNSFQQ